MFNWRVFLSVCFCLSDDADVRFSGRVFRWINPTTCNNGRRHMADGLTRSGPRNSDGFWVKCSKADCLHESTDDVQLGGFVLVVQIGVGKFDVALEVQPDIP